MVRQILLGPQDMYSGHCEGSLEKRGWAQLRMQQVGIYCQAAEWGQWREKLLRGNIRVVGEGDSGKTGLTRFFAEGGWA